MNHMEQVAKMLGVKMGEEFKIEGYVYHCKITERGLITVNNGAAQPYSLMSLLTGGVTIKKIPWKPERGNNYYFVRAGSENFTVTRWEDTTAGFALYKIGNCFKTREEAITAELQILDMLNSEEVFFNVK